jgi:hypothetical protein
VVACGRDWGGLRVLRVSALGVVLRRLLRVSRYQACGLVDAGTEVEVPIALMKLLSDSYSSAFTSMDPTRSTAAPATP